MARNEFSEIKSRVLAELHDTSLSGKVGDFVNETIDIIEAEGINVYRRTSGTLTTVASQQEYTISTAISTDVEFITSIQSRDPEISLQDFSKTDIADFDPDYADQETDPWGYWVEGGTLGLYPTPSAAKTLYVDYILFSTDLSADADTPNMRRKWINVLVDGAVYRGLKYLRPGSPAVWQTQRDNFMIMLKRMLAYDNRKPNLRIRMKRGNESVTQPVGPRIELWKS